LVRQVATALERLRLAEEARRVEVEREAERLRSSLLSSVSHELEAPLGVIVGATSTLSKTRRRSIPLHAATSWRPRTNRPNASTGSFAISST
jgi:K+-sensing histidine kinase KdpD